MKLKLLTAGLMFLSCLIPLPASASGFSRIYAFGDSLLDNGNIHQYTNGFIGSEPYFQGRLSNGLVWVEYLANILGVSTTNYAVAGAGTDSYNTLNPGQVTALPSLTLNLNFPNLPGLTQQLQKFLDTNQQADAQALYVISGGTNDYLGAGVQDANQPVSNLVNAVQSLAQRGAKNFLIPNLPDLGNLPGTRDTIFAANFTAITNSHNTALNQAFTSFKQQQPNLKVTLLDANSLVNRAVNSPSTFGYTNVTDSCLNPTIPSICSQPNKYLYWDGFHPTTYTHQVVAGAALAAVPESNGIWGILGLAALGVTGMLKKQRRQISSYFHKSGS
ncbi:MAG TPA: SGNH/GDSL hydrolase family protein [Nostocaceae cyanobacterium]|nr:SGNH/GDSL hydrolase family protein [Nostocaceae cyanobacterium]